MMNKKQDKDKNRSNKAASPPCYISQFPDYFDIEEDIKNKKPIKESTPDKEK